MAYEDEGAMVEAVETPEPTEPAAIEEGAVEESTEQPEVTEPEVESDENGEPDESTSESEVDVPEGKRSRDSAFAEMRRAREEAEAERDELQSRIEELERQARQDQLRQAAYEMGLTDQEVAEVLAEAEAEEERAAEEQWLTDENERLNQELMDIRVTQAMEEDLRAIQRIDPEIKSLDQLGDDFFNYIGAGLSGEDAYFALKAKEQKTAFGAAPSPGKANQAPVQRDYYTSEELDAMTPDEILANMDKVNRSLERL